MKKKKKRSQRCFGMKSMKEYSLPLGSKSTSIWGCKNKRTKKKKTKYYFTSSNTTLSILPTYFTTHLTS